jgi:hypothetical protein
LPIEVITLNALVTDEQPSKYPRIQHKEMNTTFLEHDLGLRPQIEEFPFNLQDEMRRAYLKVDAYQPKHAEYPASGSDNHRRQFQVS